MTKRPAIIFDLDGTLADVSHLSEFLLGHNDDYDLFHQLAEDALPIDWVVWEMQRWAATHVTIVVTARQDKFWESSANWMIKHEIPFDELYMRHSGDARTDYHVKKDLLDTIRERYEITMAYDDNPSTVKLWIENKIPTVVVPTWPTGEWV